MPYETPATEHLRNCITFCVSVPVLSEKTKSTQPSSSLSVKVRTFIGVSVSSWYICSEFSMKYDWMFLTTRTDEISVTDTKEESSKK